MSGRNRSRGAGTTFVNNVRGPTSALTSFLNERGIRRANPAPVPAQAQEAPQAQVQASSSGSSSSTARPSSSASTSRPVRSARARAAAAVAAAASSSSSRSESVEHMSVDGEDENMVSAEDDSSDDDLIPIAIPVRSRARTARSRIPTTTEEAEGSSSASTSKAAIASSSKKNSRKKKMASDDSSDEDFHDITGYVPRSNFSHKGRMPQGANKIEFCSRCRARFTVKAGTTPATDDSGMGLLCATCSGGSSDASAVAPKPVKKASRRKIQKAEIECQVPSLQDLCIQVSLM